MSEQHVCEVSVDPLVEVLSEDLAEWDNCDVEQTPKKQRTLNGQGTDSPSTTDISSAANSSSPAKSLETDASSVNNFQDVKRTDAIPTSDDDLRNIHTVHVTGTRSHILPPYEIVGWTNLLLTTTSHPGTPEGKAKRVKEQADYAARQHWDGNPHHEPINLPSPAPITSVTERHPSNRHGLKVIHQNGRTGELPMWLWVTEFDRCDHTCPMYHDSVSTKLARRAEEFRRKWNDWDLKTLF